MKMRGWSCFSSRAACPATHRVTTESCFWCGAKRPSSIKPAITDKMMLNAVLRWMNGDLVISNNGKRRFTRKTLRASILAASK